MRRPTTTQRPLAVIAVTAIAVLSACSTQAPFALPAAAPSSDSREESAQLRAYATGSVAVMPMRGDMPACMRIQPLGLDSAACIARATRDEPTQTALLTPDGQTLVKLLAYSTPSQVNFQITKLPVAKRGEPASEKLVDAFTGTREERSTDRRAMAITPDGCAVVLVRDSSRAGRDPGLFGWRQGPVERVNLTSGAVTPNGLHGPGNAARSVARR